MPTITVDDATFKMLRREKRDRADSYSKVIKRVWSERPAQTAAELAEALKQFEGVGAGPIKQARRVSRR
jgi:predicted CopG family antitoxin